VPGANIGRWTQTRFAWCRRWAEPRLSGDAAHEGVGRVQLHLPEQRRAPGNEIDPLIDAARVPTCAGRLRRADHADPSDPVLHTSGYTFRASTSGCRTAGRGRRQKTEVRGRKRKLLARAGGRTRNLRVSPPARGHVLLLTLRDEAPESSAPRRGMTRSTRTRTRRSVPHAEAREHSSASGSSTPRASSANRRSELRGAREAGRRVAGASGRVRVTEERASSSPLRLRLGTGVAGAAARPYRERAALGQPRAQPPALSQNVAPHLAQERHQLLRGSGCRVQIRSAALAPRCRGGTQPRDERVARVAEREHHANPASRVAHRRGHSKCPTANCPGRTSGSGAFSGTGWFEPAVLAPAPRRGGEPVIGEAVRGEVQIRWDTSERRNTPDR